MFILGLLVGLLIAVLILLSIFILNISPGSLQREVSKAINSLEIIPTQSGDIIEPPPEGEEVFNKFFK